MKCGLPIWEARAAGITLPHFSGSSTMSLPKSGANPGEPTLSGVSPIRRADIPWHPYRESRTATANEFFATQHESRLWGYAVEKRPSVIEFPVGESA
jgi:hypothetical protein